ncbi:hypothetical protein [Natronococcus pandeyae]|uniref:hypothetical protein n=1 Tax=Natronococcus pandeyae TaxID=2055836 RepID=UPI0011E6F419|nr:hypothetical protein [Natronococcus pandeyae]
MVALDTAVAFLHPLATIALACLWTLWILRTQYKPHLSEETVAPEETGEEEEVPSVESSEGV